MTSNTHTLTTEASEMLRWSAGIGAVTAEALALKAGCSVAAARSRLAAAERRALLERSRPLAGLPAVYVLTRAGLRACAVSGIAPAGVSAGSAAHAIACAHAAAALERRYPSQRVVGERELLREERSGMPLASVRMPARAGQPLAHRPDLVLISRDRDHTGAVAVEVELTVKTPRRLQAICTAYARCPHLDGVIYLVSPAAHLAVQRAVGTARAQSRIAVLALSALGPERPAARTIPSDA